MSLARNDMLTTGDNRAPRARRSCYVNEPACGFFVAGSSLKEMNGVYIRRNPPAPRDESEEEDDDDDEYEYADEYDDDHRPRQPASKPRKPRTLLYYEHMDTGFTMRLAETDVPSYSGYFYGSRSRDVEYENEWAFTDRRGADRFTHKGDTIVPGAGVSPTVAPPRSMPAARSPPVRSLPPESTSVSHPRRRSRGSFATAARARAAAAAAAAGARS